MKKWIFAVVLIAAIFLLGVRIVQVNADLEAFPRETYQKGEWVPLQGCFQDQITENTDSFSVRILDAELLTFSDFTAKYQAPEEFMADELHTDLVLDVTFEFRNDNKNTDNEGYVELFQYSAAGKNYLLNPSTSLMKLTVPQLGGSLGFRLSPDSSYKFHVPYVCYMNHQVELAGVELQFLVSRAPIEKSIVLQVGK